ncbi:hypothetical protein ACFPC0_11120 [Streptomyces andamanensis]|uniref:Uncharacterized protein n=1 Tax=Streptomyces andamanensis TaxID=1565035 RepID=A0ABV8TCP6_9ACTN
MDSPPKPLDEEQIQAVITHLRIGRTAAEAARAIRVKAARVYAAARDNTDVALALAGHDPYAPGAAQAAQQADYIRLLALGFKPGEAERVLWRGGERVKKWRQNDEAFARISDAVRELRPPEVHRRREHRFTPDRVTLFLEALKSGCTVVEACEEAGVASAVVYQRRRRDGTFREAMDALRTTASRTFPHQRLPHPQERWDEFLERLSTGVPLRRAALETGIEPSTVYKRRARSSAFREQTDRLRGRL